MAQHRIVCTLQEPLNKPAHEAHIVYVGTGADPAKADRKWTVAEVYTALDAGDVFYTVSPSKGSVALVSKWACRGCQRATLRSAADAVLDNNLDNLRACNWT